MRRSLLFAGLLFAVGALGFGQNLRIATAYNYPLLPGSKQDTILHGLQSIRGCAFANDVDGDGKPEIAVTDYSDNGHVCIFEVVGNDSIQLVWVSPTIGTNGGGSTPRYPLFGDLDNDGKQEIIFQSSGNGIEIFEWDGVIGSDNYGTSPSQVIGTPFISEISPSSNEYMEIADVDGDGTPELLTAYNASGSTADGYYVISATGDWNTNDPGFSSFNTEFSLVGTARDQYGLGGGSPYIIMSAQLDGTGNRELLLNAYDQKTVCVVQVTGPDTYVLPDTAGGHASIKVLAPEDGVALFGGLAYDIDNDGRDEVYLPTYTGLAAPTAQGTLHMVTYDQGQQLTMIDATNISVINDKDAVPAVFGFGYGDIDNNGKTEIYSSNSFPANVTMYEFQGGDKKNAANWTGKVIYTGDSSIVTDIRYRDSLGVKDTLKTIQPAFASKIYAHASDFDGDGLQDIILPYQAINDSINIRNLTWNSGASKYDSVLTVVVNPKRWGLRILERSGSTGVKGKDVTVLYPSDYRLEQNYPNPFNPSTTISFYLPVKNKISLRVYDLLGREVKTLINGEQHAAGTGRVTWDGTNNNGSPVVSGTYFYTLTFGNFSKSNKMILLK
jgi:FG-GAP-like repeat/FlgD Ig-like domain